MNEDMIQHYHYIIHNKEQELAILQEQLEYKLKEIEQLKQNLNTMMTLIVG